MCIINYLIKTTDVESLAFSYLLWFTCALREKEPKAIMNLYRSLWYPDIQEIRKHNYKLYNRYISGKPFKKLPEWILK